MAFLTFIFKFGKMCHLLHFQYLINNAEKLGGV